MLGVSDDAEMIELSEVVEVAEPFEPSFAEQCEEGSNVARARRQLICVELPAKVDNPARAIEAIARVRNIVFYLTPSFPIADFDNFGPSRTHYSAQGQNKNLLIPSKSQQTELLQYS